MKRKISGKWLKVSDALKINTLFSNNSFWNTYFSFILIKAAENKTLKILTFINYIMHIVILYINISPCDKIILIGNNDQVISFNLYRVLVDERQKHLNLHDRSNHPYSFLHSGLLRFYQIPFVWNIITAWIHLMYWSSLIFCFISCFLYFIKDFFLSFLTNKPV